MQSLSKLLFCKNWWTDPKISGNTSDLALVFYGFHNKVSKARWLKRTEIYCLTFQKLKVQNQDAGCGPCSLTALGRIPSWLLWFLVFTDNPLHSLACCCITSSLPLLSQVFSLCVYLCSPDKGINHIGLTAHPTSAWPHLNLIISTMTLFLNKVTFTGTRG